jgi:phenylacetate-CoA ligase
VVQHDLLHTQVLLVPGPGFDSGCLAHIVSGFRKRLGDAVAVDVQVVASIAAEKSGKFRYIVSHVAAGRG